MKIILVEGLDRLGKDSQIEKIYNEYKDKFNISIRHFGKPRPKYDEEPIKYQFISFDNEVDYLHNISMLEKQFDYHNKENLIIYNRFYFGEYVYGTLYRCYQQEDIIDEIIIPIEKRLSKFLNYDNILTLLFYTDDYNIIIDDGKSLSKGSIEKMENEQILFNEVIEHSIFNKSIIQVNNNDMFKSKDEIFNIIKNNIKKLLL